MSDDLPAITEVLLPARKKPGPKPGSPKPAGSGRKPGGKNKVAGDMREMILARGKPIELLCDISRGVKIRVGPQAGPGEPLYAYPSLQERAAAAKILIDKLVPAAAVLPAAKPEDEKPAEPMDDRELAQWVAFMLAAAAKEARPDEPAPRTAAGMARVLNGEPSGEPSPYRTPALTAKSDPFEAQREQQRREIEAAQAEEGPSRWEQMQAQQEYERELRRTGWKGGQPEPKVVRLKPRS